MCGKLADEAFDMISAQAIAFDAVSLRITSVNYGALDALQFEADDLLAMTFLELAPKFDEDELRSLLRKAGRRRCDTLDFHTSYRRKDGSEIDVQAKLRLVDEDGSAQYLTIANDLTAQMEASKRLEAAEQRLEMAIEALPCGIALFDAEDKLVISNTRYRSIHTLSAAAMVEGADFREIINFGLAHGQYVEAIGREQAWLEEFLTDRKQGNLLREQQLANGKWVRAVERKTSDGGHVGTRTDITDAKHRQLELERAALEDSLTGLANRRALSEFLKDLPDRLYAGERIAILHIDLDKFKSVNDGFGHDAGDFVLAELSRRLENQMHPRAMAARVGGDEFVLAMSTALDRDELQEFAEDIRERLREPVTFKGRCCEVGASIGIAVWSRKEGLSTKQTLLDADTALIHCKSLGRNRTLVFSPEMREQAVRDASIAAEIRDGLHNDRFFPLFQPQFRWPGGEVSGLEALARWRHPEGQVQSAGLFSHVAVETGLIAVIDKLMFDQSLGLLSRLLEAGVPDPSVSLNVSTAQLCDPYFVEQMSWNVASRGLENRMVTCEILESTLLDERAGAMVDTINALSRAGFRIELDDFGTGHTAINSLRRFPVDRIKIDRSLISGIDTDRDVRAITEGIFGLCTKLGVECLAEGVETKAELETLEEIGLRYFQGYYFARPMTAEDVLALYSNAASAERSGTDR